MSHDSMIITGDCIKEMDNLHCQREKFDLIVVDPPYNQGVDYGGGEKEDNLPHLAYHRWCEEWMDLAAMDLIAGHGSMWIITPWQHSTMFTNFGRRAGLTLRNVIIWHETFGQYAQNNFGSCHRHLLYFTKSLKTFTFNAGAIRIESERQKQGDKRANPDGKIPGNVWEIPRLVGNSKERIKEVPTQLPLALVRPIINACTNPNDRVLDPLCGSGTVGVEAVAALCDFTGIEKNPDFAKIAEDRIKKLTMP